MSWQDPVFNRTEADVLKARQMANKIKKRGYDNLLDNDKEEYLSEMIGAFSYLTANRIEGNTEYLYKIAKELEYVSSTMTFKTWAVSGVMYQTDIERLKTYINTLATGAGTKKDLPATMTMQYEKINQLERTIYYLYLFLQGTLDSYRYSGDVYSGDIY